MMDQGVDLAFQCEQIPRLDSRITLADRPDAADGLPPVLVDWRTGSGRASVFRASASRFAYYFDHTSCAELRINQPCSNSPAFVSNMRDTSHPARWPLHEPGSRHRRD